MVDDEKLSRVWARAAPRAASMTMTAMRGELWRGTVLMSEKRKRGSQNLTEAREHGRPSVYNERSGGLRWGHGDLGGVGDGVPDQLVHGPAAPPLKRMTIKVSPMPTATNESVTHMRGKPL